MMAKQALGWFSAILTTCSIAQAAPGTSMRTGSWEVTTTSDLLKLVPQITPQQMSKLQDLARQYGVDMPRISEGAAIARVCVTPQMAQQDIMPDLNQTYAGCRTSSAGRTGNQYRVAISCDSDQIRGTGSASGTFDTNASFVGSSVFDGVVQGMPTTQRAQTTGRWIGPTCNTAPARP